MASARRASSGLWVAIRSAAEVSRAAATSVEKTMPAVSSSRLPVGSSASSTRRAVGHRAGDRDALLLAAGQPRRAVALAALDAERREQLARPGARGAAAVAGEHARQHHVLERAELRQQVVELVDEAQALAADAGACGIGQARAGAAAEEHLAAVGVLEQAGDLQQRRLAGARRPHQRDHGAGQQLEVGAAQHLEPALALAEAAADADQAQRRRALPAARAAARSTTAGVSGHARALCGHS